MSKVITSTIQGFEGTVTICQPLNIYQCVEFDKAAGQPREQNQKLWLSSKDADALPALIACVERWDIPGIEVHPTLENFPTTPRGSSHQLIQLIFHEIFKIYMGEVTVPNE